MVTVQVQLFHYSFTILAKSTCDTQQKQLSAKLQIYEKRLLNSVALII